MRWPESIEIEKPRSLLNQLPKQSGGINTKFSESISNFTGEICCGNVSYSKDTPRLVSVICYPCYQKPIKYKGIISLAFYPNSYTGRGCEKFGKSWECEQEVHEIIP